MTSAIVALLCGVVVIGFAPIVIRIAVSERGELGPISMGFWRMFLAAMVLLPLAAWKHGRTPQDTRRGNALAGLACVFYAAYIVAARVLRRTEDVLDLVAWSAVSGAVILLIAAVVMREDMLPNTLAGWGLVAALGLGCHAIGQGLIMFSMARVPASLASLFLLGQPLIATVLAALLLGEGMTWLRGGAGVVVLVGIYIAQKGVLPPIENPGESEGKTHADLIPVRQGLDNA